MGILSILRLKKVRTDDLRKSSLFTVSPLEFWSHHCIFKKLPFGQNSAYHLISAYHCTFGFQLAAFDRKLDISCTAV